MITSATDTRWEPVAVSADILTGTVIPARLSTKPIAVWRAASGRICANGDRCPHRGMRLSHGFVRGETLSCIYHGWRFGTDGACQKIPAHPAVDPPASINCGPLPVAEVNGVVWAAMIDPPETPQAFPGFDALRSLVIAAPLEAILQVCGGEAEAHAIKSELAGHKVRLLTNPYAPGEVLVIVLVASGLGVADRIAVSAACETLRRSAEALEDVA